jgi:hypothetical protein
MKGKDGGAQEFHFMSREALSCNHTMFSIFAAITTMCIWILILYIRFGPLKRWKFIAYAILMFDNLVCGLLPVIARVNYSVEVFIGAMIAAILVMSQSAAFKLLFRFEQNVDSRILMQQANGESELLNDRIIPTMYEIKKRMEAYTRAAKFSSGLKIDSEELNDISNLYKDLGNGIDKAKNAKPLAPMSAAGLAISKPPPDPQNESPQAAEIPDSGDDANELVNMIAQAQDTSAT